MTDGDAGDVMAQQGHYAGALSRLLAYGADLLILTVVYAVALALVEFAINAATPWSVDLKSAYGLIIVGELLWAAFYFGNSWAIFARSPGMALLGLRIVQADGGSLPRRQAIVRLIAFPLGFLTLGIGFLGIIFGRTHQAIYDRIAKTAVVYDWDAEAVKLRRLAARGARRREAQVHAPTER
ncbi:MAG: RDD family protein [Solirubrobacteraceae bacterium]